MKLTDKLIDKISNIARGVLDRLGFIGPIALLKWETIVSWFMSRKGKITGAESKRVAVTVKNAIENAEAEVIQGIFDMETGEFVDVKVYVAEELDADARVHLSGSIVKIYT